MKNTALLTKKMQSRRWEKMKQEVILIDLEALMRVTGYGRRRAMKVAELAKARVYIGNSVRFNVQKLKEFLYQESM